MYLFIIFIGIIVFTLVAPFGLVVDSRKEGTNIKAYFNAELIWRALIVKYEVMTKELTVQVFGITVFHGFVQKDKNNSGENDSVRKKTIKKSKKKRKKNVRLSFTQMLGVIRSGLVLVSKLINSMVASPFILRVSGGFPNPATTGVVFGYYHALNGTILNALRKKNSKIQISYAPDFSKKSFDYQLYFALHDNLVSILIPVIQFLWSYPVRRVIITNFF
ncbi:DUF2953 domain-containing protein [candidate division WWE3 bacterium]|nr:DUF2953 domain-containing protein [candidate division WWE3 bacterium]